MTMKHELRSLQRQAAIYNNPSFAALRRNAENFANLTAYAQLLQSVPAAIFDNSTIRGIQEQIALLERLRAHIPTAYPFVSDNPSVPVAEPAYAHEIAPLSETVAALVAEMTTGERDEVVAELQTEVERLRGELARLTAAEGEAQPQTETVQSTKRGPRRTSGEKRQIVETYLKVKDEVRQEDFCSQWHISDRHLRRWVSDYKNGKL